MKSAMLTGATGFIGSHIAEKLLQNGITTNLFVRRRNSLIDLFERLGAKVHIAQPNNLKILQASLEDADVIIHCAGATKALRENDFLKANVEFTTNILSLLNKGQRFIFISSQAAVGPSKLSIPIDEETAPSPLSNYGKSKLLAEDHIKEWGEERANNYVILRPSVVYGPRERHLYNTFRLAKHGLFLSAGSGMVNLSLLYVADLVNAILMAAEHPSFGGSYFVAGDGMYSWEEIGNCLKRVFSKRHLFKIKIPLSICKPAVFIADYCSLILGRPWIINRQKLMEMSQGAWLCSNKKIKSELGWYPEVSLEAGIRKTAEWYLAEKWI